MFWYAYKVWNVPTTLVSWQYEPTLGRPYWGNASHGSVPELLFSPTDYVWIALDSTGCVFPQQACSCSHNSMQASETYFITSNWLWFEFSYQNYEELWDLQFPCCFIEAHQRSCKNELLFKGMRAFVDLQKVMICVLFSFPVIFQDQACLCTVTTDYATREEKVHMKTQLNDRRPSNLWF